MTATRERAIKLAREALRLPPDDRVVIFMALVGDGPQLDEIDPRRLKAEQHDRIRQYRCAWLADLAGNAAARQVDQDLQTYAAGEWRRHRHLIAPPEPIDLRRQALFEILKRGSAPRYEALRKILRG